MSRMTWVTSRITRRSCFSFLVVGAAGLATACSAPAATPSPAPAPTTAAPKPAAPASATAPAADPKPAAPAATVAPPAAPAAKTAPAASAQVADSLVMGIASLLGNLDPVLLGGQSAAVAHRMAFDTLVFPARDGKMTPGLATAWRNVDPTTWEFTLREGVKFAGGQPFDATSVKFNVERAQVADNRGTEVGISFVGVAGVDVVSPALVRVRTTEPDPLLPNRFAPLYIVGPEYPAKIGDPPMNTKTNGTGPFQAKDYRAGTSYELADNPTSWRAQGKPISLRTITMKAIPDPTTMVGALRTGEIDLAFPLPFDQVDLIKSTGTNVLSVPAGSVLEARMNIVDEPPDSPLRKKEVRQALNYALDKEALRKVSYAGFGRVADGQIVGPECFGHNPNVQAFAFDVNRAKQLLTQAGYPNGVTTKFAFTQLGRTWGEPLQGMWAAAGIKVDLLPIEPATLVSKQNAGNLDPMTFAGADYFPIFDAEPVLRRYSNAVPEPSRLWGNEQFHDIFTRSTREMDPNRRRTLLQEAVALMREEAPSVFLIQQEWVYGVSPKVSGFEPRPDGAIWFDDITKQR